MLGFSRASLFAYRKGKARITDKAWLRLEQAERAAGLSPTFAEQIQYSTSPQESARIMESASWKEVFESLPDPVKAMVAKGRLDAVHIKILDYLNDADELATLVLEEKERPEDKEIQIAAQGAAKRIKKEHRNTRELWEMIYQNLSLKYQRP